jgi:PhoD-like phosphatase
VPLLRLGPALRYVGETEATIWVETDGPCEVEILGRKARTWHVEGHYYALIYIEGLEPGTTTPYTVALDGDIVWPQPSAMFPRPCIRTPKAGERVKMLFGSCRVAAPHVPPYSLGKDKDERGRGIDALYAYARRMVEQKPEDWPHVLVWLGDQIYADEVSPGTEDFIKQNMANRDPEAPDDQVANFEEYTHLYYDSWTDETVRWLLSTVSSAMIFDDHDVHDDWNTSKDWVDEYRQKSWWNDRIVGGLMSYWIYQHIGNLSPRELQDDELYQNVCEADDAGEMLREFAYKADRQTEGARWSYCRQIGESKLIVMDSRAGRVLDPGERQMVDDGEWDYIQKEAKGDYNHLFLATSLPYLLAPGMQHLESWNEAVCNGAWGKQWARWGEKIRQELDLEHWGAFQKSFHRVRRLVEEVGSGQNGSQAPASIVFLSGDVHHAYLSEVAFKRDRGVRSAVYQACCSPFRNPLDAKERRAIKAMSTRPARWLTSALARSAGVGDPEMRWRFMKDPTFDNQVATLEWEGRDALVRIEKAIPSDPVQPVLEEVFEHRIA